MRHLSSKRSIDGCLYHCQNHGHSPAVIAALSLFELVIKKEMNGARLSRDHSPGTRSSLLTNQAFSFISTEHPSAFSFCAIKSASVTSPCGRWRAIETICQG